MMDGWRNRRFFSGWAGLGRFWAIVGGIVAVAGISLHLIGPPDFAAPNPASPHAAGSSASKTADATTKATTPGNTGPGATAGGPTARAGASGSGRADPGPSGPASAQTAVRPSEQPGRTTPGPVADPDPALQEPSPQAKGDQLPRIAPDGRRPMQVYAAGFDTESQRARVGLILAGIGMNEAESLAAARALPGGVTFAVSPYAANVERILSAVRLTGHEFLLSLPMEPTEFALSDPGPRALMTSLPPAQNLERLHWALARIGGFVGVTNALGTMRGERFSGLADQMSVVLRELDKRGLVFIDARADGGPNHLTWGRTIDLVIDEVPTEEQLDQRLEALSRLARDRGSALGLATLPRPVTVERIAAWANGLLNKGLALAPVTAIVRPPVPKDTAK